MERGREVLASFSTDSPVSSRQENEGVKGEPGNEAKEVSHVTINNLWEKQQQQQQQQQKVCCADAGP